MIYIYLLRTDPDEYQKDVEKCGELNAIRTWLRAPDLGNYLKKQELIIWLVLLINKRLGVF